DQSTKNSIGRIVAIGLAIVAVTGVVLSLSSALGGALLIFMSIGGGVLLGITAGFVALAAAIYLIITNWDKLAPRMQAALPTIQKAVEATVKGVTAVLQGVAGVIAGFIGIVDALLRGDWGDAWNAAAKVVTNFGKLVEVAL